MHFLFVSHQSDQPYLRYGQNSAWPWKNTSEIFKKICQNSSFQQNFSKTISGNNHDYGNNSASVCSDPMSRSRFIVQTSKLLLINATAVNLGQGHGKVIQYISPDPCILCAKYQRFSSNGFDMRGKSFLRRRTRTRTRRTRRKRTENIKSPQTGVT